MANNNHFQLTLDTLAPSGSITRPKEYLNANAAMTITKDDGATYMKVWFDQTAEGTKESEGYKNATWEAVAESYTTKFTETKGGLYYHLVLMDDVANESEVYNTEIMVYDTSAPEVTTFNLFDKDTNDTTLVNETTVSYTWACAVDPAPAPIVKAYLTGDCITDTTVDISGGAFTYTGTISFNAGEVDGTKTISLVVEDAAGNKSVAKEASIVLDTQLDKPVLTLAKDAETPVAVTTWINYHDVVATLRCNDTNIEAYKIWEGDVEPEEWTSQAPGTLNATLKMTLSDGDGQKTVRAKVRDTAKNTDYAEAVVTNIDTVLPATSIATDRVLISEVDGFNTAVLTMTATDDAAGLKSFSLKCGAETIKATDIAEFGKDGEGAAKEVKFDLTSANSMVEGANTITFTVEDVAGNVETKTVTVTLDTTAPANVKIGTLNEWYNADFDIKVAYEDAHIGNGKGEIYAWVSTVEADTQPISGMASEMATASIQTIAANKISGTKTQSENNYLHVKVVDEVGNVSYDHAKFGWDNVVPTITEVKFEKAAYNSVNANIAIIAEDATSGIVQMQVTGDITDATAADAWEEFVTPRSVTLSELDGDKSVYVRVKDKAGNVSVLSAAAVTELDKTAPGVEVTIYEADGVTAKPAHSPLDTFVLKIAVTDDDTTECKYQIYGNVTKTQGSAQGITESAEAYVAYAPAEGQTYVVINDLYATSGDGIKEIYVKVIDNAGNVTAAEKISFELDTAAPIVTVSDVDFNRISKIHVERLGAGAGSFADEVKFTFTPDSMIQAYKVCAYVDEAAALAGKAATDAAIGMDNGSVNMSATGLTSNLAVDAMIRGADFEAALGGAGHDGLHIVVVYVQDYAGTWSALAEFKA
jgi:hypothetical protein